MTTWSWLRAENQNEMSRVSIEKNVRAALDFAVGLAMQFAIDVNEVETRFATLNGQFIATDDPHDLRAFVLARAAQGRSITLESHPLGRPFPTVFWRVANIDDGVVWASQDKGRVIVRCSRFGGEDSFRRRIRR